MILSKLPKIFILARIRFLKLQKKEEKMARYYFSPKYQSLIFGYMPLAKFKKRNDIVSETKILKTQASSFKLMKKKCYDKSMEV